MNKYQEALNFLDWHCQVEHQEQQDLLQELVDRETPMKPKTYEDKYGCSDPHHVCPVCGCFVYLAEKNYYLDRCENCGQKIDWVGLNERQ